MFSKKKLLEWETTDSIFAFLKANIDEDGKLNERARKLPDEEKSGDGVYFAAGLKDALFGADDSEATAARIQRLTALMVKIARKGDVQSQSDFYREVLEIASVATMIDAFLETLSESGLPIEPYLFDFATKLAISSRHRNAVKMGIALLGVCQDPTPVEDIKILGLHDEFTIFVTIALLQISENVIDDLFDLAKHVDGWGRIQLVDRLVRLEISDDIRDWLVLEGYKNSIMYEYLALSCAEAGKLNEKLERDTVDNALFVAAGEIIVALMDEGPTAGMSAFDEAEEVIDHYIRHAKIQTLKISDFMVLHDIKDYLADLDEDREVLKDWDRFAIDERVAAIDAILGAKDWSDEVRHALKNDDSTIYWNAKRAAKKLGIELWDFVWEKLQQDPLDYSLWSDVTDNAKAENVDAIVDFALIHLPLDILGAGPQDSLGLGEGFSKHNALDCVVRFLEHYPSKGEKLILVALDSPVTRNRNGAIRVLETWGAPHWSPEIREKINALKIIEPNEDTKRNIERLVKGEALV